MRNQIDMTKAVPNKERNFGASLTYVPVVIHYKNGVREPALFTTDQVEKAVGRALDNKEDAPDTRTFWKKLFNRR